MADVTISSLPTGTPSGNALIPYSTGSSTLGVPVSAILQDAGNIGIGNNSPQGKLHVYDASNSLIALGRAGYPQALAKWEYNGGTCSFGTRDSDNLELITNNVSRLFMNTVGNVGVGTSSPTAKLHVAGDVKASNTPKAWVSFNGQGAVNQNQSIYSQYNISSVVKAADGRYTVNFNNALSDSNYCITGVAGGTGGSWGSYVMAQWGDSEGGLQTTTSCRIGTCSYGGWRNMAVVNVVIYGT